MKCHFIASPHKIYQISIIITGVQNEIMMLMITDKSVFKVIIILY